MTPSAEHRRSPSAALFCAAIILPCVLVIIAIPLVVKTSWFANGSMLRWVLVRDYPYEVVNANADIVIFGDSSALAGIDPLRMQRDLGLKVVNLSPILKSISMMEDRPLAAYLQHNKPPRLIVVYVAPWNTGTPPDEASPDGLIVMMRHDTLAHALHWVLRHPVQMLNADIFLGNLALGRIGHTSVTGREQAWRAQGFLPYPGVLPHLNPGCKLDANDHLPADPGTWPQRIAARYQTPQTRVVFYLAPLPNCEGTAAFAAQQARLAPRPINQLQLLDPQLFLDDYFYAHPEERFVPVTTDMLTSSLRPLLTSHAENPQRTDTVKPGHAL